MLSKNEDIYPSIKNHFTSDSILLIVHMPGSAIFSVEVELGWGYHDLQRPNKYAALSENRNAETEALKRLLTLCDRFEIPITFNVVGHLLLRGCTGVHDGQYPEGWFHSDPGTDLRLDPLFYAPELIEMIEEAEMDHEVCTHTFSHALGEEFSPTQLDTDLNKAQGLHRSQFGKPTKSIVPPRHQEMNPEVLKQNGLRVIRKTHGQMPTSKPELLRWHLSSNHPVSEPVRRNGIVTTYTSVAQSMTAPYVPQGQRTVHPFFRLIPFRVRKYIHRLYLEDALSRAAAEEKHAHFWTHLHDMANEAQLDIVEQSIELASNWRDTDNINIARMEDILDSELLG